MPQPPRVPPAKAANKLKKDQSNKRAQNAPIPDEGNRPSLIRHNTDSVRAMQKFLVSKGYNIVVDGVNGPQTQSAAQNWRTARTPGAWSGRHAPIEESSRSNPPANEHNQHNQPGDNPATPTKPRKVIPKQAPQKVVGLPRGLSSHTDFLNPDLYARASVDAKYGPIIAELERQEGRTSAEGAREVSQIGNWWEESAEGEAARATEANTANDAALQQMGSLGSGLAAALGVGADDPAVRNAVAGSQALQLGLLQGVAANQRTAGAAAPGFARQSGAAGQAVSRKETRAALDELRGQRTSAVTAKGNEYIEKRGDARVLNEQVKGERFKNQIALLNAQLAAASMPMEQQGKALEIDRMIQQLQLGQLGVSQAKANLVGTRKRNAQIGKPTPARPGEKPRRNFVQLNPAERSSLMTSIIEQLGGTVTDPDPDKPGNQGIPGTVSRVNALLRGYGYKPKQNQRVGDFAMDILRALGIKNPDPRWY